MDDAEGQAISWKKVVCKEGNGQCGMALGLGFEIEH